MRRRGKPAVARRERRAGSRSPPAGSSASTSCARGGTVRGECVSSSTAARSMPTQLAAVGGATRGDLRIPFRPPGGGSRVVERACPPPGPRRGPRQAVLVSRRWESRWQECALEGRPRGRRGPRDVSGRDRGRAWGPCAERPASTGLALSNRYRSRDATRGPHRMSPAGDCGPTSPPVSRPLSRRPARFSPSWPHCARVGHPGICSTSGPVREQRPGPRRTSSVRSPGPFSSSRTRTWPPLGPACSRQPRRAASYPVSSGP